jgi:hypothetical protein
MIIGVLLFPTHFVFAGCADIGSATSWARVNTHTIIVYRGSTPVALLKIPYCYIYSTSDIRIIKSYVCSWDKIIVDDEICDISKVERL